ncbi:MAG TPA: DUF177 domain-containing protein [Casimicrobiaceae bacterium]|nr:DUF177 domain-containing protein [Casimicrobiaceae bacterium]
MKSKAGTFDAYRLARDKGVLVGTLDIAASERLADRVAPADRQGGGRVSWRIEGTADAAGRPALAIAIEGRVPVTCQRCLADFALPVAHRAIAALAKSEADADALDATSDDEVLVADRPLDPAELIEDELLLTLPYAPVHEGGACPGGEHGNHNES